MRTFQSFTNFLWSDRCLWRTHFNMWNHISYLIKYRPSLFNIYPMVYLSSAYTDLDLGFSTLSLMALDFVKCTLIWYGIFSIGINYPHIFISLCWKLMTGWWIWDYINDIMVFKIICPISSNQFYFQRKVTQYYWWKFLYN